MPDAAALAQSIKASIAETERRAPELHGYSEGIERAEVYLDGYSGLEEVVDQIRALLPDREGK